MFAQFFSVGSIALLGAMLPGPDFAIVVKNSLLHSRISGIFTSLGIGAAMLVHMSYCVFGLALVISSSLLLFSIVKYLGAAYLMYLGIGALCAKKLEKAANFNENNKTDQIALPSFVSFRQGFLCNLLNPKATLFFLSIFTVLIKPDTPFYWEVIYAAEIICIATSWFCVLTFILSNPSIKSILAKAEQGISQLLGILLFGFGVALVFVKH